MNDDVDESKPTESVKDKIISLYKAYRTPIIIVGSVLLTAIIIIIVFVAVSASSNSVPFTKFVPPVFDQIPKDKINKSLAKWEKVRLRNEYQVKHGLIGGEGCQWPTSLAVDSDDGMFMLYGTDVAGIWKSVDGGESWIQANNGMTSRGVGNIAIDPINKKHVVYVGLGRFKAGIDYSYDMGKTWKRNQSFPGIDGTRYIREGLAFDPTSYSAKDDGCTRVYFSTPYQLDCKIRNNNLTVPKSDTNQFTDETAGLYISEDGGKTFKLKHKKLYDGIIRVAPDGTVFIGTQYSLYRSNDKGNTFEQLSVPLNTTTMDEVSGLDYVKNVLYLQTFFGIWKSSDKGNTFTEIECPSYPVDKFSQALRVNPANPDYMLMTARYRIEGYYNSITRYSHDGGKTWKKWNFEIYGIFFAYFTKNNNLDNREKVFAWNPKDPNIAITFGGDFLMRTKDGGVNWYSPGHIANIMTGSQISYNYYDTSLFGFGAQDYAGAYTDNGGYTWKPIGSPSNSYGALMADEKTIIGSYVVSWYGSYPSLLYYSNNRGESYTLTQLEQPSCLSNERNKLRSLQSLKNPEILFCGGYRSSDNGFTWERMNGCDQVFCINVIEPHELFGHVCESQEIIVSYDDGITWKPVVLLPNNTKSNIPSKMNVIDMSFDQVNKYLYAIVRTTCQWSWSSFYQINIADGNITDLYHKLPRNRNNVVEMRTCIVDPYYTDLIYLGGSGNYYTNENSLMRSLDRGLTWEIVSTDPNVGIYRNYDETFGHEPTTIRINYTNGDLLVGTMCLGMYKLSPPYDKKLIKSFVTFHNVIFETNGGDKLDPIKIGHRRFLRPVVPTRKWYTFVNWYTDPKLKNVFVNDTRITSSIKLYAKWVRSYTVTYMDGYKAVSIVSQDNGNWTLDYVEPPEHSGYVFADYYYDREGKTRFENWVNLTHDIMVYAGYYKIAEGAKKVLPDEEDYNGYIDIRKEGTEYVPVFDGKVDLEQQTNNRIAGFLSLDKSSKYLISMKMDNVFTCAFTRKERINKWWACQGEGFSDQRTWNEQSSYIHRFAILSSDNKEDCLLVQYYDINGKMHWKDIRKTLFVVKIEGNIRFII